MRRIGVEEERGKKEDEKGERNMGDDERRGERGR